MFHFSEAENMQDRIPEVHQTILERLGDSLPFVPQIAGHLLEAVSYTHLTLPTKA